MEKPENQIGYGMAEETGLVLGLRNRPVREVQRADHGFAGDTELRKKDLETCAQVAEQN